MCRVQNGMNPLHHAAKWGHTNVLKYLLSTGRCKVNAQDKVSDSTVKGPARYLTVYCSMAGLPYTGRLGMVMLQQFLLYSTVTIV